MRTDSTTLSETALSAPPGARRPSATAGVPAGRPRRYEKKVKNAQEAHEAIRPPASTFRTPDEVGEGAGRRRAPLYELIWKRTVASQMADARGRSVQVRLGATSSTGEDAEFAASGKIIEFPGFLRAYVEGADDADADRGPEVAPAAAGRGRRRRRSRTGGQATRPSRRPASPRRRWSRSSRSWASAARRPTRRSSARSRTAATCGRRARRWCPTWTAFAVVDPARAALRRPRRLRLHRPMEDELDRSPAASEKRMPWLPRFYFGNGDAGPASAMVQRAPRRDRRPRGQLDPDRQRRRRPRDRGARRPLRALPAVRTARPRPCPRTSRPTSSRSSRPIELLAAPSGDRGLGDDPETGLPVFAQGRPLRALRAARRADATGKKKPTRPRRCSSAWRSRRSRSTRRCSCSRCRAWSASTRRRRGDHRRRTAASGRTSRRATTAAASTPRSSSSRSPSTRRWRSGPAEGPGPGGGGRARSAELGADPVGKPDRGQGRPLRALRHRRRDQRVAAQGDTVEELTLERAAELLPGPAGQGPGQARRAPRRRPRRRHPQGGRRRRRREKQGRRARKKTAA